MSFLIDGESDALTISRMILHVVGDGDFRPESEMAEVEQEGFFLDRIRDIDGSGLFSFDPASRTKETFAEIARGDLTFQEGAQRLSRDFASRHSGASVDGAVFIFELSVGQPDTKLFSIVKYDYREAVERTDDDGESHLRRIVEAFVADKRALQKSCLVRVTAGVVNDEIAAQDRMGRAPDLTDYFAGFLDVRRTRTDGELNRKLSEALREVFVERRADLPGQDASAALRTAKNALSQRQQIDNAAVQEAVLVAAGDPRDEDLRRAFEATTTRKLRTAKLTGVEFAPDAKMLRRPARKRIQTVEGVTIEYPSDLEGVRVRQQPNAAGGRTIVIETARVEDEGPIRDRTR